MVAQRAAKNISTVDSIADAGMFHVGSLATPPPVWMISMKRQRANPHALSQFVSRHVHLVKDITYIDPMNSTASMLFRFVFPSSTNCNRTARARTRRSKKKLLPEWPLMVPVSSATLVAAKP